jgi:hypothetical protein
MSFFFDLTKLGELFQDQCINYSDDWASGFFAAYDYWPLFIGMIIIGLTLEHKEVFYVLVFWGGLSNALINWGLRAAISQPGPEPDCFQDIQMPAYATDGLTFLTTIVMISSGYTYGIPIRWFKLSLLWIGGPIGLYARVWLRANTPPQMMAGTAVGIIEGLIYTNILLYVFTYERIEKWFLQTGNWWRGYDYQDTMIRPYRPVVVTDSPLSMICIKINSSAGYNYARLVEVTDDRRRKRDEIQRMRKKRVERENRREKMRTEFFEAEEDDYDSDETQVSMRRSTGNKYIPLALSNIEVQYFEVK